MAENIGLFGSGTREVIKDPSARRDFSPSSVQVPGIQRPYAADFSSIGAGARDLARALGDIGSAIGDWSDKEACKEELSGRMMAQQGKTAKEVSSQKGSFAVKGFYGYQAETAAIKWKTQAMIDILDTDKALNPVAYRQKLEKQASEMYDALGSAPDEARELLTAHVSKVMPELISAQMIENAKFVKDKTTAAFESYAMEAAHDPETQVDSFSNLLKARPVGLNDDEFKESMVKVGVTLANGGAGSLKAYEKYKKAVGLSDNPTQIAESDVHAVMPRLIMAESSGKQFGGPNSVKGPKEPTTSSSGAIGIAQVLPSTAEYVANTVGIPWDAKKFRNDSAYNAKIGEAFLGILYKKFGSMDKAVAAYNYKGENFGEHLRSAGSDWTNGLPDQTSDYLRKIFPGFQTGGDSFMAAATSAGFTLDQSTKLQNADMKFRADKSNQLTTERVQAEQSLIEDAVNGGGIPSGIENIRKLQAENQYDDSWAQSMYQKVQQADAKFKENVATYGKVTSSIANGTVKDLTPAEQTKAAEIVKAGLEAQAAVKPANEREAWVNSRFVDYLVKNTVVDKPMQHQMEAAAMLPITAGKGGVPEETLEAFKNYVLFAAKGNIEFAKKQAGDAAEFFETARQFDSGQASPTAIMAADAMRKRNEMTPGLANPMVTDADLVKELQKRGEDLDPNMILGGQTWVGGLRRFESEQAAFTGSDQLKAYAKNQFMLEALNMPGDNKAALRRAVETTYSRAVPALGNVLFSGPDSTIAQDMGISDIIGEGKEDRAIQLAIINLGPAKYKDLWPGTPSHLFKGVPVLDTAEKVVRTAKDALIAPINLLTFPFNEDAQERFRGFPQGIVKYNHQTKTISYWPKLPTMFGFGEEVYAAEPLMFSAELAGMLLKKADEVSPKVDPYMNMWIKGLPADMRAAHKKRAQGAQ